MVTKAQNDLLVLKPNRNSKILMQFLALGLYLGKKVRVMQNRHRWSYTIKVKSDEKSTRSIKLGVLLYSNGTLGWPNLNKEACLTFPSLCLSNLKLRTPRIGHKDVILLLTYCTYIY